MTEEPNKKKTVWIVNITLFLIIIIAHSIMKEIGGDIGRSAANSLVENYKSGANEVFDSDETTTAILKVVAEKLNKQCPMKMDKYTTSLGVLPCSFPSNRKMLYRYQLDINQLLEDSNADLITLENALKQHAIMEFCSNPSFNKFKEHNVDMVYEYIDLDGKFLFEFVINNGLCTE